jgi:hypothetical protein
MNRPLLEEDVAARSEYRQTTRNIELVIFHKWKMTRLANLQVRPEPLADAAQDGLNLADSTLVGMNRDRPGRGSQSIIGSFAINFRDCQVLFRIVQSYLCPLILILQSRDTKENRGLRT